MGHRNSWLLGNEWDAVMNYQLAQLFSLWRDSTFTDNDTTPALLPES